METMKIYWANVCILNRKEKEKLAAAGDAWNGRGGIVPEPTYLGDAEEIQMYEQLERDAARKTLGFDLIVSTRFDIFLSGKHLLGRRDELLPIRGLVPVRGEIKDCGILDPWGLFLPMAVLPHVILRDTAAAKEKTAADSLESLLDPRWAGKVCIGSADLPSGKMTLFAMWYKFGDRGLETCVKNWRQKTAPSAARHAVLKKEYPVAVLPGVFSGPGPNDDLCWEWPAEGAPVLPSFCAVKRGPKSEMTVEFLKDHLLDEDFLAFYRDQAFAYPALPSIAPPEPFRDVAKPAFLFPDWEWIQSRDMEYFEDACSRMRTD